MFVRIATFEGGDTDQLRKWTDERRESGEMTLPEGVKRIMVLKGDRRLFMTFFESRDALQKAEEPLDSMGDQIPEELRGRRTSVDVYEVVTDETAGEQGWYGLKDSRDASSDGLTSPDDRKTL